MNFSVGSVLRMRPSSRQGSQSHLRRQTEVLASPGTLGKFSNATEVKRRIPQLITQRLEVADGE